MKRSKFYDAEVRVSTEANPFNYMIVLRGKEEMMLHYWILQAELLYRLLKVGNHFKSKEEEQSYLKDIEKMKHLLEGGDIRYFDKKMA